ncbi:MAG: SDR family oxidoreductase [Myxococcota bacterium]
MTRSALVTGASSGIGRAIVQALAADGLVVTATGRDEAQLLDLPAHAVAGDLTKLTDPADGWLDRLAPPGARCDVLVHAAGHRFVYERFAAFDPRDAARLQAVDVDAFALLVQRLLPGMMARRAGRIVAVTSLAATLGGAGAAPYAQAKAALEGLVRGLATDVGRFGITVNAVAPGFVLTPRMEARTDPDRRQRLAAATSLKRLATPVDVAGPVRFLCSAEAAYITGHTLVVDGGAHLANVW